MRLLVLLFLGIVVFTAASTGKSKDEDELETEELAEHHSEVQEEDVSGSDSGKGPTAHKKSRFAKLFIPPQKAIVLDDTTPVSMAVHRAPTPKKVTPRRASKLRMDSPRHDKDVVSSGDRRKSRGLSVTVKSGTPIELPPYLQDDSHGPRVRLRKTPVMDSTTEDLQGPPPPTPLHRSATLTRSQTRLKFPDMARGPLHRVATPRKGAPKSRDHQEPDSELSPEEDEEILAAVSSPRVPRKEWQPKLLPLRMSDDKPEVVLAPLHMSDDEDLPIQVAGRMKSMIVRHRIFGGSFEDCQPLQGPVMNLLLPLFSRFFVATHQTYSPLMVHGSFAVYSLLYGSDLGKNLPPPNDADVAVVQGVGHASTRVDRAVSTFTRINRSYQEKYHEENPQIETRIVGDGEEDNGKIKAFLVKFRLDGADDDDMYEVKADFHNLEYDVDLGYCDCVVENEHLPCPRPEQLLATYTGTFRNGADGHKTAALTALIEALDGLPCPAHCVAAPFSDQQLALLEVKVKDGFG